MVKCTRLIIFLIISINIPAKAQDETNRSAKYLSWAAFQLFPSPVIFHDGNEENGRIVTGLRWQVIPVNISFRANKYVSPVQFFMINPIRKFSGSVELFVQPEWSLGNFKYSRLGRFGIGAGSRVIIPVTGEGEYVTFSLGGKYNYRKNLDGGKNNFWGIETGVYVFYGMVGVQFNYNFDSKSKYNIGLYLKYF